MALSAAVERALRARLEQPDQTTCGSCSLVVARMINDPAYAEQVVGDGVTSQVRERFADEALSTHRTTNAAKDSGGGWQVPWPRSLGTQPWALAREMTRRAGRRGTTYEVESVRPSRRGRVFASVAAYAGAGEAVPLYVGNRWSPRHVVLVLPSDDPTSDEVRVYDPANGGRTSITAPAFHRADLGLSGWDVPWAVVEPD